VESATVPFNVRTLQDAAEGLGRFVKLGTNCMKEILQVPAFGLGNLAEGGKGRRLADICGRDVHGRVS
jgi:hypothetical protein